MKRVIITLVLFSLTLPIVILANGVTPQIEGIEIKPPIPWTNFRDLLYAIIRVITYIALAVAPLMIIIAGVLFVTSGGNPQQIDTAKRLIIWTLIGLVVILLARGIVELLSQTLLKEKEPEAYFRNLFFCFSSTNILWIKAKFPFFKNFQRSKLLH